MQATTHLNEFLRNTFWENPYGIDLATARVLEALDVHVVKPAAVQEAEEELIKAVAPKGTRSAASPVTSQENYLVQETEEDEMSLVPYQTRMNMMLKERHTYAGQDLNREEVKQLCEQLKRKYRV